MKNIDFQSSNDLYIQTRVVSINFLYSLQNDNNHKSK